MRFMFPRRSLLTPFFLFLSLGLLSPVWGQTGCPSVLTYGQSASCTLENAGETDAFTFSAQAGDRVIMAVGRTLGTFVPKIKLNGPSGPMACPVTDYIDLGGN